MYRQFELITELVKAELAEHYEFLFDEYKSLELNAAWMLLDDEDAHKELKNLRKILKSMYNVIQYLDAQDGTNEFSNLARVQ